MRKTIILSLILSLSQWSVYAQRDTIDISGNNTSSNYVTYDKTISIPSTKTVDVLMSRYTYFQALFAHGWRKMLPRNGKGSQLS